MLSWYWYPIIYIGVSLAVVFGTWLIFVILPDEIGSVGVLGLFVGVAGIALTFLLPIVGIVAIILAGFLIIAGAISKRKVDN